MVADLCALVSRVQLFVGDLEVGGVVVAVVVMVVVGVARVLSARLRRPGVLERGDGQRQRLGGHVHGGRLGGLVRRQGNAPFLLLIFRLYILVDNVT